MFQAQKEPEENLPLLRPTVPAEIEQIFEQLLTVCPEKQTAIRTVFWKSVVGGAKFFRVTRPKWFCNAIEIGDETKTQK